MICDTGQPWALFPQHLDQHSHRLARASREISTMRWCVLGRRHHLVASFHPQPEVCFVDLPPLCASDSVAQQDAVLYGQSAKEIADSVQVYARIVSEPALQGVFINAHILL